MTGFALTFFLTLLIILGAIVLMALGVIKGRAPIQGSCGGLAKKGGCEICKGNTDLCRRTRDQD